MDKSQIFLACPFCGCNEIEIPEADPCPYPVAWCSKCHAQGAPSDDDDAAREAWNRRAGAPGLSNNGRVAVRCSELVSWHRAKVTTETGDELPAWVLKQGERTILTAISQSNVIEPVEENDRKLIVQSIADAS